MNNAEKVAQWRAANVGVRLDAPRLRDLIGSADLRGADLRDADLRGADLWDANLWDADLWGADLRDANLRDADLRGADLRDANLWGADLRDANLRDADLRGADLRDANLWDADLRGADLRDANLWGADLCGGLPLATPSGSGYMVPTADGWLITIGCWRGKTLDDLRALIADEVAWPESTGAERERRRPILASVLALCEAHTVYYAARLATVVEKWGSK